MRLRTLFLLPLLFACFFAQAQQLSVTGTVTSLSDGFPLPGVTIQVKTKTSIRLSTMSSPDGKYKITINDPENEILVFSYKGYLIEEIAVKHLAEVNVALTEDIELESDRISAREEAREALFKKKQ